MAKLYQPWPWVYPPGEPCHPLPTPEPVTPMEAPDEPRVTPMPDILSPGFRVA